jgi:hypothetical protein
MIDLVFVALGLDPTDLGEDFVGGSGPDEGFRVGVPVLVIGAIAIDHSDDRGERAATDGLFVIIPNQISSGSPGALQRRSPLRTGRAVFQAIG